MALAVSECIEHINSTLGGATTAPPEGYFRIINGAGQYLMNCRQWFWCQGGEETLHLEGDKDHVWLPADFRDLIAIEATQGLTSGLTLTDLDQIIDLRTKSLTTTTTQRWGAITYVPRSIAATGTITLSAAANDGDTVTITDGYQASHVFEFDDDGSVTGSNTAVDISASGQTAATSAAALQSVLHTARLTLGLELEATVSGAVVSVTSLIPGAESNNFMSENTSTARITVSGLTGGKDAGAPVPRIDIWPTPTADEVDAYKCYYRRGWKQLHQDEHEIAIPEWLETVFLLLCRAYARGYVREDVAGMNERIAAIRMGPDFQAAMERDAEMQPSFGLMQGGAAQTITDHRYWPFDYTGTNGPS